MTRYKGVMKMHRFLLMVVMIFVLCGLATADSGTHFYLIPGSDQVYFFGQTDDYYYYRYVRYSVATNERTKKSRTEILVKYLSGYEDNFDCLKVEKYDFKLENLRAEYFFGIYNDLLFIDEGTGPDPRGLIIYDLKKKIKVYDASYCSPIKIDKEGVLSFWKVDGPASKANHPYYETVIKQGLEPVIERKVYLDLKSFLLKESNETRPSELQ